MMRCLCLSGPAFLAGAAVLSCSLLLPADPGGGAALRAWEILCPADGCEYRLSLKARSRGASLERVGREAAALRLLVDGRYDQHIVLFRGDESAVYEHLFGPLSRGRHELRIEWDRAATPALDTAPELVEVATVPIDPADPAQEAVLRAPVIYLRSNLATLFTDFPLLLYWDEETEAGVARTVYTVIFSNEDGGTNTERLMARWGRTTDIEWCYAWSRRDGAIVETIQGRDHEVTPFRGRTEGRHPLLYDIAENNIFGDAPAGAAEARVRLFPIRGALAGQARETVQDRHPWIYALMAKEMIREGKFEHPGDPATGRVSDPRNYAFVDFCSRHSGTEIAAEIRLRGPGPWYRSDHGDPKARIGRNGCARTTVELPPGTRPEDLLELRLRCYRAEPREGEPAVARPEARLEAVPKVFLLREDYAPGENLMARTLGRRLRPGQSLTLSFRPPTRNAGDPSPAVRESNRSPDGVHGGKAPAAGHRPPLEAALSPVPHRGAPEPASSAGSAGPS
jgi:hypothetical protein